LQNVSEWRVDDLPDEEGAGHHDDQHKVIVDQRIPEVEGEKA
jgi:hypothetical protein